MGGRVRSARSAGVDGQPRVAAAVVRRRPGRPLLVDGLRRPRRATLAGGDRRRGAVHYGVSTKMLAIALEMLPPVLFQPGTEAQRLHYLPKIVRGDEGWCQLISEPAAGRTSPAHDVREPIATAGRSPARRSGRPCRAVTTRSWSRGRSGRTSALRPVLLRPRHEPPRSRGATAAADVGRVSLQRGVPRRRLRARDRSLGQLGAGWTVLRTMLASERAAIGGGTSARSACSCGPRRSAGACRRAGGASMVGGRLHAGAPAGPRQDADDRPRRRPGGWSAQQVALLGARATHGRHRDQVIGPAATLTDDAVGAPWIERLLFAPGLRIGGGTDEIQRNVIAERGLGLPRERTPSAEPSSSNAAPSAG